MKTKFNLTVLLGFTFVVLCGFLSVDPQPQTEAVYLTWQRDPAHTMTVHWIDENPSDSVSLYYRAMTSSEILTDSGVVKHLPLPTDHLYVHEVELTDLCQDTTYAFSFTETGPWYSFRTAPEFLKEPLSFVVGGDMYHEGPELLHIANRAAASHDPLFVLAGGDLAYAGQRQPHMLEDGQRWIDFLRHWSEDMVRSDGTLIPMVPVIGNHDVNGRYKQPHEHAKYFYQLFSFPGLPGYNCLDFGDYMSVLALDSNHTNPIAGTQTEWLKDTLQARESVPHKFAAYHVPAYPSVRSFCGKHNPSIRRHWVKLFDQMGLNMAFEHHEHAYKRTHPLKGNRIDPQGTIYMGDGAWGTTPRTPRPAEERWYLAHSKAAQHIIVVTVTPSDRKVSAIDVQRGLEFDRASQVVQMEAIAPAYE